MGAQPPTGDDGGNRGVPWLDVLVFVGFVKRNQAGEGRRRVPMVAKAEPSASCGKSLPGEPIRGGPMAGGSSARISLIPGSCKAPVDLSLPRVRAFDSELSTGSFY